MEQVRANFSLLSCDASQERNRNCSEKTCSDELFCFGWIFSGGFSSSEMISPPKLDSQKEGVQSGNPETIRGNQGIRTNLRIDSRESVHLSFGKSKENPPKKARVFFLRNP